MLSNECLPRLAVYLSFRAATPGSTCNSSFARECLSQGVQHHARHSQALSLNKQDIHSSASQVCFTQTHARYTPFPNFLTCGGAAKGIGEPHLKQGADFCTSLDSG